ncbi:MAG: Na+ dependent nucleoside transporter [Bacteroidales bacterium]|nr:Na+ dependent nucleoside transporter [Bacteroidales bacterium]
MSFLLRIVLLAGVFITCTVFTGRNDLKAAGSHPCHYQPDSGYRIEQYSQTAENTGIRQIRITIRFISLIRGVTGILFLLGITYLLSSDRSSIRWKLILSGLVVQIVIALAILYIPAAGSILSFIGRLFIKVLDSAQAGSVFLFGDLARSDKLGVIFAFQILPTIIFFSALMSVMFYLGIIQFVVKILAWLLTRIFALSGSESLVIGGNIFLGQIEAPLMAKAYIPKMSDSEIFMIMVSGLATIAGGVMAAYIGMLGGDDYEQRVFFARHLLTASVMAAPGAVVISKMLVPQVKDISRQIEISRSFTGHNLLDALTKGTYEGLKIAVFVGAILIVFISMIDLLNSLMFKTGEVIHINQKIVAFSGNQFNGLSLEFILGYLFAPVTWIIGVSGNDIAVVGRLLGEKIIFTEFIGYAHFSQLKDLGIIISQKSSIMCTYMLCGFANFASVGILIAGIGSMAPNKRELITKYGIKALAAGTLVSLLSATIIGMII